MMPPLITVEARHFDYLQQFFRIVFLFVFTCQRSQILECTFKRDVGSYFHKILCVVLWYFLQNDTRMYLKH